MTPLIQGLEKFVNRYDVILQEKEKEKDLIWAKLDQCKLKEGRLKALGDVISDQIHSSYTESVGRICEVITACLLAVYDRNFEFSVETASDGKSKPIVLEHVSPTKTITYDDISSDLGDGLKDVVMFGIHVMSWAFSENKTRNTLLLDEPFSALGALSSRVSPIIKQLCEEMGLQIIMTTHTAATALDADRIFTCDYKDNQTIIKQASFEEVERMLS